MFGCPPVSRETERVSRSRLESRVHQTLIIERPWPRRELTSRENFPLYSHTTLKDKKWKRHFSCATTRYIWDIFGYLRGNNREPRSRAALLPCTLAITRHTIFTKSSSLPLFTVVYGGREIGTTVAFERASGSFAISRGNIRTVSRRDKNRRDRA